MVLERELEFFRMHRGELVQHHSGKYALVIGETLLGTFDTAERAYEAGLKARGNVPMLIQQITAEDVPERIPALSLVFRHAGL